MTLPRVMPGIMRGSVVIVQVVSYLFLFIPYAFKAIWEAGTVKLALLAQILTFSTDFRISGIPQYGFHFEEQYHQARRNIYLFFHFSKHFYRFHFQLLTTFLPFTIITPL